MRPLTRAPWPSSGRSATRPTSARLPGAKAGANCGSFSTRRVSSASASGIRRGVAGLRNSQRDGAPRFAARYPATAPAARGPVGRAGSACASRGGEVTGGSSSLAASDGRIRRGDARSAARASRPRPAMRWLRHGRGQLVPPRTSPIVAEHMNRLVAAHDSACRSLPPRAWPARTRTPA